MRRFTEESQLYFVKGAEMVNREGEPQGNLPKAAFAALRNHRSVQRQFVVSKLKRCAHSLIVVPLGLTVFFCLVLRPEVGHGQDWVAFSRAGAPNESLQCFSPSNVTVSGGNLIILTRTQSATCSSFDLPRSSNEYTSGSLAMRRFSFLYGTVEFRARFGGGAGSGAWPVVWMADVSCQASDPNGTDEQCNNQEIDIAEIMRGDFAHVNEQIHVDNFTHNDGCTAPASSTSENFHVYRLVWAPGSLVFKIDGTTTCVIRQPYVPKTPMYIKITVFAGEQGGPIKTETLPWETFIDYVRVTQRGKVVFDDEFNGGSKIQPGPAGRFPGLAALNRLPRFTSMRRLSCAVVAISARLFLAGDAMTFRHRSA